MAKGKATVRIQRKVSKKRYLNGKHTHTHERFYVSILKQITRHNQAFPRHHLKIIMRGRIICLDMSRSRRGKTKIPIRLATTFYVSLAPRVRVD